MRISATLLKLLKAIKADTIKPFIQDWTGNADDLARLFEIGRQGGFITPTDNGWALTPDGRAVLEFADELGGKAVG